MLSIASEMELLLGSNESKSATGYRGCVDRIKCSEMSYRNAIEIYSVSLVLFKVIRY